MRKSIWFPNTAPDSQQGSYREGVTCDEIKTVYKNGEMANVRWFEVWLQGKVIAEIKESVCNIFYQ